MDIEVAPVMKACSQMMKSAVRQHQYRLKRKYFDPFPLNLVKRISPVKSMIDDQWNALVESRKNPERMGENTKMKNPLHWIFFQGVPLQQREERVHRHCTICALHTKKPKFLQHVWIHHVRERTSGTNLEA